MSITFTSFHTEKDFDFVTIYNGSSLSSSIKLEVLHGQQSSPQTVNSTGNYLYITFITDYTEVSNGFSATIIEGKCIVLYISRWIQNFSNGVIECGIYKKILKSNLSGASTPYIGMLGMIVVFER